MTISVTIKAERSAARPVGDTLLITTGTGEYPVSRYLNIYKTNRDVSPAFILDSLKQTDISKLYPARSFSERLTVARRYWLRLTLKNALSTEWTGYFQFNSQVLDVVKGYQVSGSAMKYLGISGTDVKFDQRAYRYYDLVYPISLKAGETAILLFMIENNEGDDIRFLPQLRSVNIFKAEEEHFYIVEGLMTGAMFTIFVLNAFLGIALRERIHLIYGLYILAALYEIYSMQGTDIQYLYPGHPQFSGYLQYISPCVLALLMTRIMQLFLDQKAENSKIKLYVDIGMWSLGSMIPVTSLTMWLLPDNRLLIGWEEIVLAVLLFIQCLLLVISAIEEILQKFKPAVFYLVAVSLFIAGLTEFIGMVLFGSSQELLIKNHPNHIELGFLLETIVVFLGIVYRYNLFKFEKERLVTELSVQQQNLLGSIVRAEEAERKRIAEDLHDDVGSTLSTLSMHLSNVDDYLQGEEDIRRFYQRSLELSNKAFNDIRFIAHNLLPLELVSMGLFAALENKINDLNMSTLIFFSLIKEGNERKLSNIIQITIYRIINELLNNVSRHSMASQAVVQVLVEENAVQIMTEDDGVGFDPNLIIKGIGLKNIKNRVAFLKGEVVFESNEDGTQTIIQIPI